MDLHHTRFRTDLVPDHVPAVILESNKIPPTTIQDVLSQALPNKNARRKSLDSSKQSAIINSLLEPSDRGGPIECDIYSLPLDNLPPGFSDPTTAIIDEIIRHRFKKYDKSNKPLRHSIHIGERLEARIAEEQSTGRGLKVRNSQRQQRNLLELEASSEEDKPSVSVEEIVKRLEPNNNDEAERNSTEVLRKGGPSQRHKKRRGENGESQNAKDKIENTHPSERTVGILGQKEKSSQHINNEDSVKEDAHGSPGKEKRNFGHTFFNLFRRNRIKDKSLHSSNHNEIECSILEGTSKIHRALPSPPFILEEAETEATDHDEQPPSRHSHIEPLDVGASLEKVKDCGWYWGPLSSEGAEDLLRGEPDGSFIVRDSSDARYIFSLTFKLNGLIRHVRIEHDQGNFSFGPRTRFKAATIVDFVEKAVAHSRSGRYLFFLHRRPVLGPIRVQLLHPYSRFIHPRSLQHMCRFVILKTVRKDLINHLSLPKPILEYLNAPQYYFEQLEH